MGLSAAAARLCLAFERSFSALLGLLVWPSVRAFDCMSLDTWRVNLGAGATPSAGIAASCSCCFCLSARDSATSAASTAEGSSGWSGCPALPGRAPVLNGKPRPLKVPKNTCMRERQTVMKTFLRCHVLQAAAAQ